MAEPRYGERLQKPARPPVSKAATIFAYTLFAVVVLALLIPLSVFLTRLALTVGT